MKRGAKRKPSLNLPGIKPGNWQGELLGSCTVNLGQIVQDGPPRQAIEFTYAILPAAFTMPELRFRWPGIVMIMPPTPMKTEFEDAGHLFKGEHLPSLTLSLEVTRHQFSDLLRLFEASRLKDFHFTVENERDGSWPIFSWGMSYRVDSTR